MNGYDALNPNAGFLSGASAPVKKGTPVIFHSDNSKAPGFPGFFAWLAQTHPDLFNLVRVQYPNLALITQFGSPAPLLGDASLTPIDVTAQTLPAIPTSAGSSWTDQIVGAISSLAPTVIATVDQQKIFNTQLSRAQQGLPPLNTTSYGLPSMQGAVNALTTPVIAVAALGIGFLILRRK